MGPNPTDRRGKGSKHHLLVDGRGVPLSLVVAGANAHDVTQLEVVLDAIAVKRPAPKQRRSKHLCADAGYRGKGAMAVILAHGYITHVVSRKSEAAQKKKKPKKQRAAGWWRRVMGGLTGSGNYWCATRNSSTPSWRSITLRLPSSPFARSSYRSILFTDKS